MTYICVDELTIIGSDNGLSPGRRQAIIWTNAGILLIGPLGTNFSEILIAIETFPFKKKHLKMSSGKCRPFCLGLNVLTVEIPQPCTEPSVSRSWFRTWTVSGRCGCKIFDVRYTCMHCCHYLSRCLLSTRSVCLSCFYGFCMFPGNHSRGWSQTWWIHSLWYSLSLINFWLCCTEFRPFTDLLIGRAVFMHLRINRWLNQANFGCLTHYGLPVAWLILGHPPMNYDYFLASDLSNSFHTFSDKHLIGLS